APDGAPPSAPPSADLAAWPLARGGAGRLRFHHAATLPARVAGARSIPAGPVVAPRYPSGAAPRARPARLRRSGRVSAAAPGDRRVSRRGAGSAVHRGAGDRDVRLTTGA